MRRPLPAVLHARIAMLAMLVAFQPNLAAAQDVRPDRFGLGPAAIAGWFGSYNGAFVGGEGFVRIARGSFWRVRLDGAYVVAVPTEEHVNLVQPDETAGYDTRTLGQIGTLMATATLGPASSNGLRFIYGLLGFGGAATRWDGGIYQPAVNSGGQPEAGIGAGPSFTIVEAGIGSEFHALLNDRIELRAFRTLPTPPSGNRSILGAIGASLTIGVVW